MKSWLKTVALKLVLFGVFALIVLNPNLKRAGEQLSHLGNPESLIQTNFASLVFINREIDALQEHHPDKSEPLLVEEFIFRRIKYLSDYENWWNVEYWPTAQEVWQRKQEDCDGRAILATSILRSRGFQSAQLVVGLDHMWIQVNENEKEPGKSPHMLALLRPDKKHQIPVPKKPDAKHFLELAKAFFQPTALRETSEALLVDIPSVRKAILILGLLLLCYYPCSHPTGLLFVLFVGVVSATIFMNSSFEESPTQWKFGFLLVLIGSVGALAMSRISPAREA
jgi:hypothetical protein